MNNNKKNLGNFCDAMKEMDEFSAYCQKAKSVAEEITGQECVITDFKRPDQAYVGLVLGKGKDEAGVIAPVINLTGCYKNETDLKELKGFIQKVVDSTREEYAMNEVMETVKELVLDWNQAKEHLFLRLMPVNTSGSLDDVVCEKILDLVYVAYLKFEMDGGSAMASIKEHMLETWGVSKEEVLAYAKKSMIRKEGFSLSNILDLLRVEIVDHDFEDTPSDLMYVFTNKEKNYGALGIFLPGIAENVSKGFRGEGYYVIPSSIHEVLIIPDSLCMEPADMKTMIREVNDTQVEPEERLSYNLYHYDMENGFKIA